MKCFDRIRAAVFALLLSGGMAGCASQTTSDEVAPLGGNHELPSDAKALTQDTNLTGAPESGPQPTWNTGDWRELNVQTPLNPEGTRFKAVVVADSDGEWTVYADQELPAVHDAINDYPFLGRIGKDGFAGSIHSVPFRWYEFPIRDNQSWGQTIQLESHGESLTHDLTYQPRFLPTVMTPDGPREGFEILAITTDGKVFQRYNYVPAFSWFTYYEEFIPPSAPEDLGANWTLRASVVSQGQDWKGTYVSASAEKRVNRFWFTQVNPHEPEKSSVGTDPPVETFSTASGATHAYLLLHSVAVLGYHRTTVQAPDGSRYESEATATSFDLNQGPGTSVNVREFLVPNQDGTWAFATWGAGGSVAGGGTVWEIVVLAESFL